ncbi:MAG: TrbI/VirB10 family protein [Candidatus Obscuribacterales bacterium]|nr:TrbI/VirB10 family protein [Candidatus Obscuribacterales bacterium]
MRQNKNILILSITTMGACLLQTMSPAEVMAQAAPAGRYKINDSRQPRYTPAAALNSLTPDATMSPKNVPDFATQAPGVTSGASGQGTGLRSSSGAGTALKADLASTTIPTETRMKLVLETAVDARSSQPGDVFEAHVKDDLYLGMTLLLPRGSLVRGRVAQVTKPRLLSRAGRIGLKLEQLVTPQGEVIPLDADLEFKKGMTNRKGQLDPGTNFGTRVEGSLRSVSGVGKDGQNNGALIAANIATLGAPVVATALGSSAIAIFSQGDNVSLAPGQELEVLLTNDLGLQIN